MKSKQDPNDLKSKTKQLEEETRKLEEKLRLARALKAGYDEKKSSKQMAFQIKTKKTVSALSKTRTSQQSLENIRTGSFESTKKMNESKTTDQSDLQAFLTEINLRGEYLRKLIVLNSKTSSLLWE